MDASTLCKNLRSTDLLAKTAGVSLSNTLRVLDAMSEVMQLTGRSAEEIIGYPASARARATELEASACYRAYQELLRSRG